ncbi:MAG: PKD domain-containing protein, partial [Thermoplasmata archaeon]|nr:PKD domain-containing protein [Thermoplasmata archaeon]
YTINMANGVATLVGPCGGAPLFIDIAIDGVGKAYAIDLAADSLFSVNLATGAATLIGSLTITLNYAQDACYDIDNGKLYLAAYVYPGSFAALYTINVATGAATLVGNFPAGNTEVDCFAIPYATAPPNNPPNTPGAPSGPSNGYVDVEYDFTASTTDPDGDNISYMFDWGDSNNSGWVGPYASGTPAHASYMWAATGDYQIKVKAKDENGGESNWSLAHTISIVAGPILKIENITGGLFKIKATIKNIGEGAANNINWSIKLTGGLVLLGKDTSDLISTIASGGEQSIASKLIIGFGKTVITVTATAPDNSATKQQNATILLFFIIIK